MEFYLNYKNNQIKKNIEKSIEFKKLSLNKNKKKGYQKYINKSKNKDYKIIDKIKRNYIKNSMGKIIKNERKKKLKFNKNDCILVNSLNINQIKKLKNRIKLY